MVTVVVLSKNPPDSLVKELLEQTYQDFEVIYAKEDGIVNAMNNALAKAQGDIFVRIDDDVSLPKRWLEKLIEPFSDPQVAGVTGGTYVPPTVRGNRESIRIAERPNWFLRWLFDGRPYARAKIYNCGSVSYGSNFPELMEHNSDIDHLEGTNWAMRTSLIWAVGGFDPKFDGVCEWFDTDVVYKVKKLEYAYFKFVYASKAYLWHLLKKTESYDERFAGWGRIKNWLRFHFRHSKFHYKKVVWLCLMTAFLMYQSLSHLLAKMVRSRR